MNHSGKILGGVLAAAGIITYILCTEKGKNLKKTVKENTKKLTDTAEKKYRETRENVRENVADKVFEFAVNHRQTIGNAASIVLPYLLKNMVKKKL